MHLATLRPTQPGPVLTAIATGKLPMRTGVRSAALYRVRLGGPALEVLPDFCFAHALVSAGLLDETPHTSASWQARPLWAILGASGIAAAIVRWPLTAPARPLHGDLVTDRLHLVPTTACHLPAGSGGPTARRARIGRCGVCRGGARAGGLARVPRRCGAGARSSLCAAHSTRCAKRRARGCSPCGMWASIPSATRICGRRCRAHSATFPEEEQRRYGGLLEQYYRYVDGEIGRAIERLGRDDLLLVVSPFGMQPLSLPKRLLERVFGNAESGTHERAPDGFLMAFGPNVRPGRPRRASVLDVTPTVLYYFGLPIGRDMDGYARTDVFTRAFTAARPLAFIPTYER